MSGNSGRLEIYRNKKTFNFPEKVVANVLRSPYFRSLYQYKTFNEVVDEIYSEVSYLEPWVAGKGVGTPSSAFCLLYKLFTLKLSAKQVRVLLKHRDSPYIRALGFLYLRFGIDPRELWNWFESYLTDEEEIVLKYNSMPTTIGKFVRDLLTNPKFFDVVLPRIPVTAQKEIDRQLNERFPNIVKETQEETKQLQKKRKDKNSGFDTEKDIEADSSTKKSRISSEPVATTGKEPNLDNTDTLWIEDLKKRYGDASDGLELPLQTQKDSESEQYNNSQVPAAVQKYLKTL